MDAKKWIWPAAGLLLSGAAVAWSLRPPLVEVIRPEREMLQQTVLASGTVSPPAEIRLGAVLSTTALEVHVDDGDMVKEGQLLVQLDDREADSNLEEARARLAAARAGRSELQRLSEPAARARLEEADANLLRSTQRFEREKALHADGVSTDVELEDAQNAFSLATAQRAAAVLQVRAASSGGSQSLATEAAIAEAEAQLRTAEERKRRHAIIAPCDGTVLSRTVEPGDAVAPGTLLLLLSRAGQTRLIIEPDERVLAFIERGQPAIASTEAFPEKKFEAHVSTIAPAVDPKRGTIEVELLVDSPPEYLRPHMTTSVEVIVATKEQALIVPQAAVLGTRSDPHVLVVRGRVLKEQAVKLGIRGDKRVEVLEGLGPEDRVAAAPQGLVIGKSVRTSLRPAVPEGQGH